MAPFLETALDLVCRPELTFGALKTLLHTWRGDRLRPGRGLTWREFPYLDSGQTSEDPLKEHPHALLDKTAERIEIFLALAT
jgi:hypothetical protein